MNIFMVYHVPADSWNTSSQFPIAGFLDEEDANLYAASQKGYGLGIDWFVKAVPLNPEV